MTPRIAIVHTAPATIEPLKTLAKEILPDYEIINLMDDSILAQILSNGGDIEPIEERLTNYMRVAEQIGAQGILHVCSSIRELVPRAQQAVSIPIVCIDEAMAEAAVARGSRIGVAATLPTTLQPTLALLQRKADAAGRAVELIPVLADEAFQRLQAGDQAGHDALLRAALEQIVDQVDVVVLAQASMARVVATLPTDLQTKFLSSPRLGLEHLKAVVGSR